MPSERPSRPTRRCSIRTNYGSEFKALSSGVKVRILLSPAQQFEAIPERLRQRYGQGGLGYLLFPANGNMDTALLLAVIVALTVLGIVLFALIGLVERLMLPPHDDGHASLAHETM